MKTKPTQISPTAMAAGLHALTVAAWLVAGISSVRAQAPILPQELVAPKIEISGGNVNFTVQPSVAGRSYQLQWSETMSAGTWQDLGSVATGDGNNLVISTPHLAGTPRRFYRLALDGILPVPIGFSLIPAGTFTMGRTSGDTDSDAPPVTVNVSVFYMAKYEVTKALWDEVRTWGATNGYTDLPAGEGKAANHPVYTINWFAMVKWCNARSQKEGLAPVYTVSEVVMKTGNLAPTPNWSANGYRLPTEAEWEKAARGGVSGQRFPWGNTITHSQANFWNSRGEIYQSGTTGPHPTYGIGSSPYSSPVGSFAPNGYGLYDMVGNMWEWCWDWYGESTYVNGATNPRGGASGRSRVFRGGSWNYSASNCRAAVRSGYAPTIADYDIGFRLARSSVS